MPGRQNSIRRRSRFAIFVGQARLGIAIRP